MSHSLVKIWIHGVINTQYKYSLINKEFESILYRHLKEIMEEQIHCPTRIINGTDDHLHILFLLNPIISVADTFQRMKGESSHWINQSSFLKNKFAWQKGYGAFSVSESIVGKVKHYIKNQKEHHKQITFISEYEALLKRSNLIINTSNN